ncbi:hypothetical protein H3146_11735 [Streptomyces sp. OF3]|uniref:Uncharacterized protein n=1 Tax=Streptomyces alkaliterrae TaxID=2213162 RepID=A0A7W3WKK7_9ACTN|nr:hypothetical protein [Streptomyces alkaliterrae]MBB1254032.1 hypothetical protein [Streptomyces alkaliterrae]
MCTVCANSPNRAKDVVSDIRTAYDCDAPPTKSDVTAVATLKPHNGTTASYLESPHRLRLLRPSA